MLEKSKATPDEVVYLELTEHSINSDHKPSLDVRIKGATVKKIELGVQLGFKLRGFVLKIQNGGLKEIQTGNCEARGTIKYGTLMIAEKKLEPIKLPLTIAIPSEIQYLTTRGEDVAAKSEKPAVVSEGAKAPANDVERIELSWAEKRNSHRSERTRIHADRRGSCYGYCSSAFAGFISGCFV